MREIRLARARLIVPDGAGIYQRSRRSLAAVDEGEQRALKPHTAIDHTVSPADGTPSEVARQLAGISTPWYVAAGWALDLFHGRQTRAHGDIEIAIPAGSFPEVRHRFPGAG